MKAFIKDLWMLHVERAKARKALRLLSKQEWSVEFLIYLLNKAVEISRKEMHIVLRNGRQECIIYAGTKQIDQLKQREKELDLMDDGVRLEALLDAAQIQGVI